MLIVIVKFFFLNNFFTYKIKLFFKKNETYIQVSPNFSKYNDVFLRLKSSKSFVICMYV